MLLLIDSVLAVANLQSGESTCRQERAGHAQSHSSGTHGYDGQGMPKLPGLCVLWHLSRNMVCADTMNSRLSELEGT